MRHFVRTPPSEKKSLYKPGEWTFRKGPMIVDVQQVVAGYMFTGALDKFTKLIDSPSNHPSGSWRTQCSLPLELARCSAVSRTWRKECLEWRKKEMTKMMEDVCGKAVDRAFDLCDRDCYPYRGRIPAESKVQHALFLQRQEVVAMHFRRHGAGRSHVLTARVSVPTQFGRYYYTEGYSPIQTPQCGWKLMQRMSESEVEEWQTWYTAERKALYAWILDKAVAVTDEAFMDPIPKRM